MTEQLLKAIETAAACKEVRTALAEAHKPLPIAPVDGPGMTEEEADDAWDAHLRYISHQ